MATACGADIIFVAYAWLRELLILTVTVMVIAISAIAIVVALIRGAREGRRHGSVPAYVGWNLGWTLAGLVLVFVVLPTMAVWAWKLHWSVDDAHGRQRAAWTLPLWNAAPGGLGKALEDVLDSRAMRSGRNRDHLLDTLRRLLVAYDQELAPADRTTLATLPARLRKFETRPPDARR
ncbi:MAG TPA: hypothetical protein PKZ76_15545 [Xanthomonadaceae bacterium]|nr:hypothetical protein [Xanthomonadaceae bacterium]